MDKCPSNVDELYLLCMKSTNKTLRKLIRPLSSLKNMIGMNSVKTAICRQIIFFITVLGINTQCRKSLERKNKKKRTFIQLHTREINTHKTLLYSNRAIVPEEKDSDDEIEESDSEDEETLDEIFKNRAILGNHFLHILIQGAPGVGKTTVAHIIYNIWVALGIVLPKKLFVVTKADLISGYMGKSVSKTRKIISKAKGGVICIDECYSLISSSDDQYGSEVLAEIVNSMSNPTDHTIFFFCGYQKSIQEQLFATNAGLKRRFGTIFTLDLPNPEEIFLIFCTQLKQNNRWKIRRADIPQVKSWFASKHNHFLKQVGASTQILCKLSIEESVLKQFPLVQTKNITFNDIQNAFTLFQEQTGASSTPAPLFLYT